MKLKTREVAIFGMLGALMYASKVFMELLPNVHLLGVFTISFTLVYWKKALYPIYTYVLLNGLFICDMVDTVSVSLDNSVGRDHAASTKNSEEDTANCVYGSKCMSRIFVWNTLCPGTGNSFWTEFQRDDCLDYCWLAVGFCAWHQQFLLWNIDCSDRDTVVEVRETSGMRSV